MATMEKELTVMVRAYLEASGGEQSLEVQRVRKRRFRVADGPEVEQDW
jgi:hypothetical protein